MGAAGGAAAAGAALRVAGGGCPACGWPGQGPGRLPSLAARLVPAAEGGSGARGASASVLIPACDSTVVSKREVQFLERCWRLSIQWISLSTGKLF